MIKYKVIIAEDHTLFRDGLASLLSSKKDLEVVGKAADGLEAKRMVQELAPDLVLMDLSMPNLGGLEAIHDLKRYDPDLKILVVSMHSTENHLRAALNAGADGYLLKIADQNEFYVAIEAVLAGKSYISSEFTKQVLEAFRSADKDGANLLDVLTLRERQVLKLVAEGNTNKQIGELLCISHKTVDNHRTNIMRKLDLHSAMEVSEFARRYGILVDG